MNERYQKNTAPTGKTRRSAASARPKRPIGEGGSKPAAKAKKAKASVSRPSYADLQPQTDEYKRLRRVWWGLLLASLVLTSASFFVNKTNARIGTYMILVGYGLLGGALFIDLTKLRRMRKEWAASQARPAKAESKKPADGSAEKSDKS